MSDGGKKPNLGQVCDICGELRFYRSAAKRDAARSGPGRPWRHVGCCGEQQVLERNARARAQSARARAPTQAIRDYAQQAPHALIDAPHALIDQPLFSQND